MNDVITKESSTAPVPMGASAPVPYNPFGRMQASHVHAGTIAIESERAVAESQAKMLLAQRFPRDEATAFSRVMAACQRKGLAEKAFYSYPRGGETISGPTIRLAEELARCWGRIEYGIRELSRRDGESEMQAYAIDLENLVWNTKNFAVRHIRDTRNGKKDLVDERDIYELTANMGGRRLRSCIMAILPPDLKDAAIDQCRKTIAGDGGVPISDRIKRMVAVFATIGVSSELLTKRLRHKLDSTTPDELADLHGIFTSIKDNVSKIDEWFSDKALAAMEGEETDTKDGIASVVQKQAAKAATKPDAKATKSEPTEAKPDAPRVRRINAKAAEDAPDSKPDEKESNPKKDASQPAAVEGEGRESPQSQDDGPVF